jgi:hypothetical protein
LKWRAINLELEVKKDCMQSFLLGREWLTSIQQR